MQHIRPTCLRAWTWRVHRCRSKSSMHSILRGVGFCGSQTEFVCMLEPFSYPGISPTFATFKHTTIHLPFRLPITCFLCCAQWSQMMRVVLYEFCANSIARLFFWSRKRRTCIIWWMQGSQVCSHWNFGITVNSSTHDWLGMPPCRIICPRRCDSWLCCWVYVNAGIQLSRSVAVKVHVPLLGAVVVSRVVCLYWNIFHLSPRHPILIEWTEKRHSRLDRFNWLLGSQSLKHTFNFPVHYFVTSYNSRSAGQSPSSKWTCLGLWRSLS